MLVLQNDAGPDAGRELIFRQSNALALEILWRLDAVGADINRIVAESARDERGHAHIGAAALRHLDRKARHGQFADIEIHAAKSAEENFLRRQIHEYWIDAVDLDGSVHQWPHPVVVADRD